MELSLRNPRGEVAGSLTLSDAVFGVAFHEALIHQVVTAYQAAARAGTKAQKTRAEVSGGNQKPWKQKGSGRARAGTTRGPLWRTGGRAFAAKPRSYEQKVNRKAYRLALRSILSELVRQDRVLAIESFVPETHKTGALAARLQALNVSQALILTDKLDRNLLLATRNLPNVEVLAVDEVDPVSLVHFDRLILTKAAAQQLEARLS